MSSSKQAAGRHAAEFVEDGMTVGLGTGSTVFYTLERIAERIASEGIAIRAVPTSVDTQEKARKRDIPLVGLDEVEVIDLTIDGADEIDPNFHMVKGGGGALLREKVVASISSREVVVVGREKLVDRLGTSFLLPVEVVPFARPVVVRGLRTLGAQPALRQAAEGEVYLTDNGNEILDCHFPEGIADPRALERQLDEIVGVVESGLFVDLAHVCVIGEPDGSVEVREKAG